MKRSIGLVLALLASCAAPVPEPEGDRSALAAAFQQTLGASYLVARFEGSADGNRRAKGTSRWYRSGVLLVDMEESGGGRVRLLKIGAGAWAFDESAGAWIDAAKAGRADVGGGFANPVELISALNSEVESFQARRGAYLKHESGPRSREFLKPLLGGVEPAEGESRLGIRVEVGGPDRMRIEFSGRVDARRCMAWVNIRSSGTPPPMQFDDVPSPFTPEMNAAVLKATEAK
jgi:hypothetical protein